MRLLFEMDLHDYAECTRSFVRNSARSIIIRNGKVAMVHSLKYDYYKFPGGGIEAGENPVEAMIRETREEVGLTVILDSVKLDEMVSQDLDSYESGEGYRLEFMDPQSAIQKNRNVKSSPYNGLMFEREARILEMLIAEKYL